MSKDIIEAFIQGDNDARSVIWASLTLEDKQELIETIETNSRYSINSHSINPSARFTGASWFKAISSVDALVVGCGGIGSWVAFFLARLGVGSIRLVDKDTVSLENLSGQLFKQDQLGMRKIDAVREIAGEYSNYSSVISYASDITLDNRSIISPFIQKSSCEGRIPVVFLGTDNMTSRSYCAECVLNSCNGSITGMEHKSIIIDGRLAAESYQVFTVPVNIMDYGLTIIDRYREEFMPSDDDIEDAPCSYKQTSHIAAQIATVMTQSMINLVHNMTSDNVRQVNFYEEYDGDTHYRKTISL